MLKNLHRALCALMIAAGCGGGDDGDGKGPPPDGDDEVECGDGTCDTDSESFGSCPEDCPPVVNCGDGACGGDESCALCAQDCGACAEVCGDGVCSGTENCTTCTQDCGCGEDQVCRENACAPISTNPLIASMPGEWVRVVPSDSARTTITVDPTQPGCERADPSTPDLFSDLAPGDACVFGFHKPPFILDGTRLRIVYFDLTYEGQVWNNGMGVSYNWSDTDGNSGHEEWQKE